MSGYVRQSHFTEGDIITDTQHNSEYNQLVSAFDAIDGHKHDGSAGEGSVIGLIGDPGELNPKTKVQVNSTDNSISISVNVLGVSVEQLKVTSNLLRPTANEVFNLGTDLFRYNILYVKDLNAKSLKLSNNVTVTQILDESNLGSNSPTAIPTQRSVRQFVLSQSGGGIPPFTDFGKDLVKSEDAEEAQEVLEIRDYQDGTARIINTDDVAELDWAEGTCYIVNISGDIVVNHVNVPTDRARVIWVLYNNPLGYQITAYNYPSEISVFKPEGSDLNLQEGSTVHVYSMQGNSTVVVSPIPLEEV